MNVNGAQCMRKIKIQRMRRVVSQWTDWKMINEWYLSSKYGRRSKYCSLCHKNKRMGNQGWTGQRRTKGMH